ncbi:CBS domain-containing protein [Streptomyces sp. HUAS ZL42]|uniref:CBS domain-containing protein n=1 Tax=Streptomyces sp. HUAS ZL42 TaxID=3231715 RepID=UPI00345ECA55
MRARDLAGPYPTVSTDDDVRDAARLLVRAQLPALLVLDRDDYPYAVVPSARVIGALSPWYMREGPIPTIVVDDHFEEEASGRVTPAVVGPDAPPSQIAGLMARKDTPIVAVVEPNGDRTSLIGAVTATALLEHIIGGS